MIRITGYADNKQRMLSETVLEIVLPYDSRKKSRLHTQTVCGKEAGLFLERGNILKEGDLLCAESGEVVRIRAADEEISTASCTDKLLLLKAAYHLGNRHVPLQVGESNVGFSFFKLFKKYWLRYQPDYVLDDMLVKMGLSVVHEKAPFHPESGAYGSATNINATEFKLIQSHSHHGHAHDHEHQHGRGHHHHHG